MFHSPQMVKKRVPEWLNSSLWSSSTPSPSIDDDLVQRYTSNPTAAAAATTTPISSYSVSDSDPPSTVDPPIPVAPPKSTREDKHLPEPQFSDSFPDHEDKSNNTAPSPEDISRQSQLLAELSRKVINLRELRRISSQGIPDGAGIRSTVWKLLLGYLPPDRGLWLSELAKKRSQYKHFKVELLMNPSEIARKMDNCTTCDNDELKCQSKGLLSRSEIPRGEHPLSLGKSSVWNQFFQDTEIIEQIDRDVKRTHPDMHFFSGDSQDAKSNQDALKTILVIFAKLNPGIRYVQGMNEILAPLFYVLKNDPNEEDAASAEADTFFCFVELLSGFRDHFCQQLDNSVVGIRSTITRLSQLLKEHDEELWRHLEITTKVNPQFYAFRWITLLLTQEFNFADSLHIWDTLLSDPEGPQETLLRVCCAMLILIRRRLLAGDFTSNLKLLQNYPPTNISHLLYVANKLRVQSSG
ncbi:TBC1 domain family member 13-like isoform X1 [Pyrus x bretschneideri]|uniref:TBC1 domain family member 13-like isoform X1 n=1 Tax=Pyrus x bretschneideri TaxID=225117 RepID=UPI00202EDD4B|nr:TBC1 domain family member 13-like isoform X1 [Pyrus x bretschneideri]